MMVGALLGRWLGKLVVGGGVVCEFFVSGLGVVGALRGSFVDARRGGGVF